MKLGPAENKVQRDTFVSVVVPFFNQVLLLCDFVKELSSVLETHYLNYEIVLVNDGSTEPWKGSLEVMLKTTANIRMLELSRRFGEEAAVLAGLESAIGDYVVVMEFNTDPPSLIPDMVDLCRKGSGVVIGVEKDLASRSLKRKWASGVFHWYCRQVLQVELFSGTRLFRVFNRTALNALLQIKDRVRNLRHMSGSIGFRGDRFTYDPIKPFGKPNRGSLLRDISSGLGMILANSRHPLRLVTWMGLLASGINLLYLVYVVLIYLLKSNVAEGWTTLSLQQGAMFFLVFIILTVMSEYLGLVLWETRNRPVYFVSAEYQGDLGTQLAERRNVVQESN